MWVVADLDDDYIAKMEDVLEVYERPYDPQEPVICVDEKPITLHADVRPASPAVPGREARRDNEYERCGTANVFCAVEPKAGRHFTFATPDRSGFEFARVAVTLAMAYPEAETIHLVLDNLNIHRRKALADVFGAEMAAEVWDRFTVHYTPTHGSWLNQAEIEIGIFSRQCLGHRRIPDLKTLRQEAKAWNRRMNRDRVKIAWKFAACGERQQQEAVRGGVRIGSLRSESTVGLPPGCHPPWRTHFCVPRRVSTRRLLRRLSSRGGPRRRGNDRPARGRNPRRRATGLRRAASGP